MVFNDQNNEFDKNKLANLESNTVKRSPLTKEKVSNKKLVDDDLDENTVLRFIQHYKAISRFPLEIMFTILQKNREQILDKTVNKTGNSDF